MFIPHARKAFVRHQGTYPEGETSYAALKGFSLLGIETAPFYGFGDLETSGLANDTVVCGYVCDVREAFQRLNCPILAEVDYPKELRDYLGRNVRADKFGNVRYSTDRFFLKPVKQKLFTGHVRDGSHVDMLKTMHVSDDADVWVSDVVGFTSEYRVFVMYGSIVGMKWYKGDPFIVPQKRIVLDAVSVYTTCGNVVRNDVPHACTIDFGVTKDDRTLVIEVNEGFAFGTYGLGPITYARMLDARWRQVVGCPPSEKIYVQPMNGNEVSL